jgi:hypothetical protein
MSAVEAGAAQSAAGELIDARAALVSVVCTAADPASGLPGRDVQVPARGLGYGSIRATVGLVPMA